DGFLFLGNSESIGEFVDLFAALDRKWKLYQRKETTAPRAALIDLPAPPFMEDVKAVPTIGQGRREAKLNIRKSVEQVLLSKHTPTGVLINEKGETLYIHGRSGKYLEPASGEVSVNILRMAREGLRLELTTAIRKVITQKQTIRYEGLRVKANGDSHIVNLIVRPVTKPASMQGLIMVVFEDVTPEIQPEQPAVSEEISDKSRRVMDLERELKAKEEHLQTTIEELETSNEELKSTNEELQSTNEELQSTNEELETSKEELQSTNEELVTVNTELQKKVDELSEANNDINNLLASTQIGTIFLDTNLRIKRFTPTATEIFNLIVTDVGRPLSDVTAGVPFKEVDKNIRQVLSTLDKKELEVHRDDGHWYSVRIIPYRTGDNVIDGVAVTFLDIDKKTKTRKEFESAA
ncbi:MAG: hypothetical protein GY866_00545, partial [Proteobacteria bacterium]|nr:hypothetical protein [Pseudomonadota bacterium]